MKSMNIKILHLVNVIEIMTMKQTMKRMQMRMIVSQLNKLFPIVFDGVLFKILDWMNVISKGTKINLILHEETKRLLFYLNSSLSMEINAKHVILHLIGCKYNLRKKQTCINRVILKTVLQRVKLIQCLSLHNVYLHLQKRGTFSRIV